MLTHVDLAELLSATPQIAVSILMPTHVRGSEVLQDPIRLKNLVRQARAELLAAGVTSANADNLLAPATALLDDSSFWQHQEQGLALFLDGGEPHIFTVALPLAEHVVVGTTFHVRPLLPLLAADGAFGVLTISTDKVRLFKASRFALVEEEAVDLPTGVSEELGELDYESPVQASPVARPHTGTIDISNAQVYGDSPEDWRKDRLVDFVRKVAAAVDERSAAHPVPLVLVAGAEIGGHFQKFSRLGPLLAGVIETNPDSMRNGQLHDAAYAVMRPQLDADRTKALDKFQALQGSGDPRAATGVEAVLSAAQLGRVDTLLLTDEAVGTGQGTEDELITSQMDGSTDGDLVDAAVRQTLQHGGRIHLLSSDATSDALVGAILRY